MNDPLQNSPASAPPSPAYAPMPAPQGGGYDDDEISLSQILDTLYDGRYLIAIITAVITVLGSVYALMARPVYQADMLVQVEDSPNSANNLLGQVSSLFDTKTAASAEMEILRSRMVVSRAVDSLRLYIEAQPKYFPLVGGWMARQAKGLSEPGLLGVGGYAWGLEKIEVSLFNVPEVWTDEKFVLEQGAGGQYTLVAPNGQRLAGTVGQLQQWATDMGPVELQVPVATGKPGVHFVLARHSRLNIIERLQDSIKIAEKGKQSGVISATLEGTNPKATTDILNEIGKEYVRQNVERKAEEAANTLKFLDVQLPQIKRDLEAAEASYNEFRNSRGTVDLGEEGKALLQQATLAETRLLELRQKREELVARFTPAHPSVVVINKQYAEAKAESERIAQQIKRLPLLEQDTLRITRDVKVNNELYAGLLNSAQQLKLIKAGKVGNVRLVDAAVVPEDPVKPRRSMIAGISLLLGLLAGTAVAFVRKAMHGGIDDPADIESKLGMTVYATIPHSLKQEELYKKVASKAKDLSVLATLSNSDAAVESLRSFRTALQFALLDAPNNIVMISGATPALGKSFVSVNFANVVAAAGKRVLLVDADLRKGYLHQYFGRERGRGLSELVAGTATADQAIARNILPNLDFLSTGQLPPNPAELLMNDRLAHLLRDLSAQYDQVIIDSPPALAVSDTAVLGRLVGATFLVARENVTSLGELEETQKRLVQSGIQVKGVLFNDIKPRPGRYGYGYRYRYKYGRYGYRYSRYSYEPYRNKADQS